VPNVKSTSLGRAQDVRSQRIDRVSKRRGF
jgi:hypothetical protein